MYCRPTHILFALFALLPSSTLLSQDACENCIYYQARHFNRIEDHPVFGSWHILKTHCVPLDGGKDFKVSADGTTSSKIEVTQIVQDGCEYMRTDPMVEFIDENLVPIMDPTPEEHGVITVISMTETTVYFEYTHPTNLPPTDSLKRQVRIGIKDLGNEEYNLSAWLVINIYRYPVLFTHGLWANGESFEAMANDFAEVQYEEYMVASASYEETNGAAFATNADVVPSGINLLINRCRDGYLSAGKVNLVGHSMGGILSRLYLQGAYRNDVHRLVTCNTPHSGSQFANYLLDPYWWPQNLEVCTVLGLLSMPCYEGAVRDLCVDSAAIADLNAGAHPAQVGVHALMTTEESLVSISTQGSILSKNFLAALLTRLGNSCGLELLDTLFEEDVHDLVVAGESQKGGLSGNLTSSVQHQMHIGSTANPEVITKVKDLLNEAVGSSKFTTTGYAPPDLSYNNNLSCGPFVKGKDSVLSRTSTGLAFEPPPGDQAWEGGDTVEVTVHGPGIDTIIIVFEMTGESVFMQKQNGPDATFSFVLPEEQSGPAVIVAIGYSADEQLQEYIADTMEINAAYTLTGISVYPTKIFLNVNDTANFQVIGHFDDGIDRLLNGHPDLVFDFTTWSARATADDDILLLYPENDTLIVSRDSIVSPMVKIFYSSNPAGPVFWLGGTGDWDDDAKWDIGCPPGPGNSVYIDSGHCTIPLLIAAEVKALEINQANLTVLGSLQIAESLGNGLKVDQGTLTNHGTIQITDPANTALWLNGTSSDSAFIFNYGSIALLNCTDTYGAYISTRTYFLNDTSGTFSINQCGAADALSISSGIGGITLENNGTLSIDGGPLSGGRIRNSGMLTVAHTVPDMYEGLSCYFLHNTPSGTIILGNNTFTTLNMSFSTDSLVNEGQIVIHHSAHGGMRVANTLNSGSIQITDVIAEGIDLEGNNFMFENTESGSISIMNAGTGIYTRNTGCTFNNSGTIDIDSVNIGIQVKFNSVFTSGETGSIAVSNCTSRGIDVLDNTNTIFENAGAILVSETGENGIHASSNGIFTNLSSGNIQLQDIGGSALATSGLLSANTKITNKGIIDIALPVGSYGIDHTKRFTNDTCGVLRSEKAIRVAGANFINYGFLHLNNTEAHSLSSAANFQNYGWIEDSQGLINTSTQLTNHAVIAQPVDYSGCSGDVIMDFFEIGSFDGFSISDGYVDRALSINGGALDTMSNLFTPNTSGIVNTTWFFDVTDLDSGCMDTIALKAAPVCPVNCPGDPHYWTGCTDPDWNNFENWNAGTVPGPTDGVVITSLPAGGEFPEILLEQSIDQLLLKTGALLTVKSSGQLTVHNE